MASPLFAGVTQFGPRGISTDLNDIIGKKIKSEWAENVKLASTLKRADRIEWFLRLCRAAMVEIYIKALDPITANTLRGEHNGQSITQDSFYGLYRDGDAITPIVDFLDMGIPEIQDYKFRSQTYSEVLQDFKNAVEGQTTLDLYTRDGATNDVIRRIRSETTLNITIEGDTVTVNDLTPMAEIANGDFDFWLGETDDKALEGMGEDFLTRVNQKLQTRPEHVVEALLDMFPKSIEAILDDARKTMQEKAQEALTGLNTRDGTVSIDIADFIRDSFTVPVMGDLREDALRSVTRDIIGLFDGVD